MTALVSCQKEEGKEWGRFFGYEQSDIVGTYSFSNISDAFDGLGNNVDGQYCHVCKDAQIKIERYSSQSVTFNVNCPTANFSYTFQGNPKKTDNDFLVTLSSRYFYASGGMLSAYKLMAYVYKNEAQQVRLHGFAAQDFFSIVTHPDTQVIDTVKESSSTYYFDVIKN